MTKGEQTREAILSQALDQASVEGLEGLSIGALACRARMSKSGLFAHFGSKEALQLAVLQGPWWLIDDVAGPTELYRMTDDPFQETPQEAPGSVGESLESLAAERRTRFRSEGEHHEVSEEVQQQLEELGYPGGP